MITSDVENYPGYAGRDPGAGDDGRLPAPGGALRRRVRHGRRHARRLLRAAVPRLRRRRGVPRGHASSSRPARARGSSASSRSRRSRAAASRTARPATAPSSATRWSWSSAAATRRWRRRRSSRRFASKVVIVHRRTEFRASPIMVDRARANEKIEFVLNAVVEEVLGQDGGHVTGVRLRDTETGETSEIAADGIFVAIGHDPTTALFLDWLDHDDQGYLVTEPGSTRTNIPGVFAAGDVQDHTYRQAVTAAGSGTMAALDAQRWLETAEARAARSRPPPRSGGFRPRARRYARPAVACAGSTSSTRPARRCWRRFPAHVDPEVVEALRRAARARDASRGRCSRVTAPTSSASSSPRARSRTRIGSPTRRSISSRRRSLLVTVRKTPAAAPAVRARAGSSPPSRAGRDRPAGSSIGCSTTSPTRTSPRSTPSTPRSRSSRTRSTPGRRAASASGSRRCGTSSCSARRNVSATRQRDPPHPRRPRRGRRPRALPGRRRASLRRHVRDARPRHGGARHRARPARRRPRPPPVEDRREPGRHRQEADRRRVARPRPVADRRLLRPELRGRVRRRLLGPGRLGRAHRVVDDRPARSVPLAPLDLSAGEPMVPPRAPSFVSG